jgi:hypothetical protein
MLNLPAIVQDISAALGVSGAAAERVAGNPTIRHARIRYNQDGDISRSW